MSTQQRIQYLWEFSTSMATLLCEYDRLAREVAREEAKLLDAVNASCTCGGKPLGVGCCPACEVWHRMKKEA